MRKYTAMVALGVLMAALATLVVMSFSDLTKSQRDYAAHRLVPRFLTYRGKHGDHFPSTLQQLLSAEPLEPDLKKLVQAGRVSYTPPKDLSGSNAWEIGVDGSTTTVGPAIP